jgi:hypothetical protein
LPIARFAQAWGRACARVKDRLLSQDPDEEEVALGSPQATPGFAPCIVQGSYPDSSVESLGGERYPQLFSDP